MSRSEDRKRKAPFLDDEIAVLVEEYAKYKRIFEPMPGDKSSTEMRKDYWQKITSVLNSRFGHGRTWEQVSKKWSNCKQMTKEKLAQQKRHAQGTGGGSPIPTLPTFMTAVATVYDGSASFHGITGGLESGAPAIDRRQFDLGKIEAHTHSTIETPANSALLDREEERGYSGSSFQSTVENVALHELEPVQVRPDDPQVRTREAGDTRFPRAKGSVPTDAEIRKMQAAVLQKHYDVLQVQHDCYTMWREQLSRNLGYD